MLKCYIIGAVTGLPREVVEAKFKDTAEKLKSAGFMPVVPIDFVPEDTDWHEAMRMCITKLMECEAYTVQEDYHQSKGAMLEKTIAVNLDLIRINAHKAEAVRVINLKLLEHERN